MLEPTLNYVRCPDFGAAAAPQPDGTRVTPPRHRMAYWEWNATGDANCPHVVLCVHGLSRQGRDFDTLLIGHYHTYIPAGDAVPVLCNGSLIGYNEYARLVLRAKPAAPKPAAPKK